MDIRILVAVHKDFWAPSDEMYLPLQVGTALSDVKLKYQGDDDGDNISAKNDKYSELTGLYWAWKNLDADAIGLAHYRRYLAEPGKRGGGDQNLTDRILTKSTAEQILSRVDAIVAKKRKYVIETIYSHYDHTHDGTHLNLTGEIIERQCPDYLDAYNTVLKRTSAHMFNMFVMKRDQFRAYCAWLFPILEELEGLVDDSQMTPFERRYLGRIGELLLDVWIDKNQISYEELSVIQLGKKNWFKKVRSFLGAKFRHKKYEQSL
ncbi:MAG: DUF4422 domain-containing protein [Lachnospiraceae bacterium]|nr:DUF4422 domain-containing protein [Lachnospiraceae bacterium]